MRGTAVSDAVSVALGAAAGGLLRHAVTTGHTGSAGLFRVFAVNVAGSFVLGAAKGARLRRRAALTAGTGFCGGLTTFSTFAAGASAARPSVAAVYIAASCAAGVGAVLAGAIFGAAVAAAVRRGTNVGGL